MSQTIPVVNADEAKETAYDKGFDKFTAIPMDDIEELDLAGFRDGAEYSNHILPSLRALAGFEDSGYGTWQGDRDVAVFEEHQADDIPIEAEGCKASDLMDELLDAWERGAEDAAKGEDRYATLDF